MFHRGMRRVGVALLAADLALAFIGLCLATCLRSGDAHACCRRSGPALSAQTDGCCLDTDGVRTAAAALTVSTGHQALLPPPPMPLPGWRAQRSPEATASPPLVLRI